MEDDDNMTMEAEEPDTLITRPTTTQVQTARGLVTAQFDPRVVANPTGVKPTALAKLAPAKTKLFKGSPIISPEVTKWLIWGGVAIAVVGVGYYLWKRSSGTADETSDIDEDVADCGCGK
jgi:hypothetical protein